jgi:glycosyltransferase involved in cell wall biosynthesis
MDKQVSIVVANRNRDSNRIENFLNSLENQVVKNFEVVFVDYGSYENLLEEYQRLIIKYNFFCFISLKVGHLLWNKSKALNHGIKTATGNYIFIADIDLIFHPNTTALFQQIKIPDRFYLFNLGYLDEEESKKIVGDYEIEDLKVNWFGKVNGMILTSKDNLIKVNGFDEFFHFYGAEDEDLFARLENAGVKREFCEKPYFFHQWHQSFSGSEDKLLTGIPRIKNIMRINQRHFQLNRDNGVIRPLRQKGMGEIGGLEFAKKLLNPDTVIKVPNILARVEHLLKEELPSFKNRVIMIEFFEDAYYSSLKYRLKRLFGKQTQPYISMKEVNDMVLKEILFNYRNHNYSFKVKEDLKIIFLCLQL